MTVLTVSMIRIFLLVAVVLVQVSCGSFGGSNTPVASTKTTSVHQAEIVIAKRHAESMLKSWQSGDRAAAAEQYKVIKGLLDAKDKDMAARLHGLLPGQTSTELGQMAKILAVFEAKPLESEDEVEGKYSLEELENHSADKPVSLSHEDVIRHELKKILIEFGESDSFEVPDEFYNRVKTWITVFTDPHKSRKWYERALKRMDKYYPMISGVFAKRKLPEALYFMAFVESGFNPYARSRVGAVGLWQFMPATGRRYGLKVGRRVDHRKDPVKATRAAREYILDLILEFGDGHSVLLAMAAYNAGENRIRSRLRRLDDYRQRSFWALADKNLLPRETRNYVPKILASAVIARNKALFGFDAGIPAVQYASLTLNQSVSVPLLAELSGLSQANFLEINPDLDSDQLVTPDDAPVVVNVPKTRLSAIKAHQVIRRAQLAKIEEPREETPSPVKVRSPRPEAKYYIVYNTKRGNNLNEIAAWFNTDVRTIKENNPFLKTRPLKVKDQLYLYEIPRNLKTHYYRVESGDHLYEIASLYSVSPALISEWNGLRMRSPREGDLLTVYTGGTIKSWQAKKLKKPKRKKPVRKKSRKSSFVYTVKYRNSLHTIALAFKISKTKLRRANKLRGSRINIGQKLRIPRKGVKRLTYRVRSGDTLQKIARKYTTSIRSIQTFNGLRSSRIVVGERLLIYKL